MVDTVKKPAPKSEPAVAPAPKADSRIDKLEAEIAAIKATMRRNGWTLPE